jgi:DNA polymerase III sliding clamp (beta) subunit (PCNA family)
MPRSTIADAAALAARIPVPNAAIPIRTCLAYTTDASGNWRIEANDLETSISVLSRDRLAQDAMTGIFPAKAFTAAVKTLKRPPRLTPGTVEGYPILHAADTMIQAKGRVADWPTAPKPADDATTSTVATAALMSAIAHVLPSVTRENMRFALNGALIDVPAGVLVGTDGHRLHSAPCAVLGDPLPPTLVPRDVLALLGSIGRRKGLSGTVQIRPCGRWLQLVLGLDDATVTVTFRALGESFPNYARVFPGPEWSAVGPVDGGALLASLAPILGPARASAIPMLRMTINGSVALAFESVATGLAISPPPVPFGPDGTGLEPEVRIGLNPCYLADALARDTSYMLHVNTAKHQIGIYACDGSDRRAVIMPMRL